MHKKLAMQMYMKVYVYELNMYIYICTHCICFYILHSLVLKPKKKLSSKPQTRKLLLASLVGPIVLVGFGNGSVNGCQFDAAGCTKGALSSNYI